MTAHKMLILCIRASMVVGVTVGLIIFGVVNIQAAPLTSDGPSVFINEIHYDNDGTDSDEAIEIAGPAGTDLAGWKLLLYNGNGGVVYTTTELSGLIPDQQDGYSTLFFSYPANGIQNGAPDGMALVDPTETVIQFLSYEGTFTATDGPAAGMTSVDIGVSEASTSPPGHSLQLTGTGSTYLEFTWASSAPNTFGAVNTGQAFEILPPPPPPTSVSIYDLQYTTDPNGESPLKGQIVTTEGVVTAVFDAGYFIQDPAFSSWSGLWVYDSVHIPYIADALRLTGTVAEYNGLTELGTITGYEVLASAQPLPNPVILQTVEVPQEHWESMLVRVESVTVTDEDLGYGEWQVDDGSGGVVVDDMGSYAYIPVLGDALEFVMGPLNYDHSAFKIEPRDDSDIGAPAPPPPPPPPPVTIHDIQFTTDPSGDSPYKDQSVITQGVVTAFFNAGGDRYTFIQDGTGPWSGLLLYKPNGFVNVGDLLQIEGVVSEHYGMTEIASGLVTVLGSGNPLPEAEILPSGEVGQEMWESVLVRVENATVINADLGYGEWSVDDGSGVVRMDDLGSFSYVPVSGDFLDFAQGPLNYDFGNFKIEPRNDSDLGVAPSFVPICAIQGSGFVSPYEGQTIRTQGLVVADFDQLGKRGFFLQKEDCDGDPTTSDGIFVYINKSVQVVSEGDLVELRGVVSEYFGLTEFKANVEDITILSEENSLPVPFDLNPPFNNEASDVYFESLEGMLVSMDFANVVGPTDYYDETFLIRSDLGLNRIFQDHPEGTGVIVAVDDSGRFEIQPEAKVGDQVIGLLGALDYSFDDYKIQLTAPPILIAAPDPGKVGDVDGDGDIDLHDLQLIYKYFGKKVPPAPSSADLDGDKKITYKDILAFLNIYRKLMHNWNEFSVATFNLENLFDMVDDPGKEDPVSSSEAYALKLDKVAEAIHDDLGEPTILAVQEAENVAVLMDLAARPEIKVDYGVVLVEGPDVRGIDVGLLYQADRVKILGYESRQGCTTRVDGLGPDGNSDVLNPANDVTCDTDGDGVLDGNRLFSRPPLVVHLEIGMVLPRRGWTELEELWVIVNHFKSKSDDTELVQYTLPRRVEQATFVGDWMQEIQALYSGAKVIVLGDLNDFLNSETLAVLEEAGLSDLLYETPKPNRYSYIYQGESEVMDHILINQRLLSNFQSNEAIHINADYPVAYEETPDLSRRSSDHDAVVAKFMLRMWRGW